MDIITAAHLASANYIFYLFLKIPMKRLLEPKGAWAPKLRPVKLNVSSSKIVF